MFKCEKLYKHVAWTDIAMMPLKVMWIPEKRGWKVKYMIYNVHRAYPVEAMNIVETIFIPKSKKQYWKKYG